MTFRIAMMASRRSVGKPFKYSSTVLAALFMGGWLLGPSPVPTIVSRAPAKSQSAHLIALKARRDSAVLGLLAGVPDFVPVAGQRRGYLLRRRVRGLNTLHII